MATVLTGGAEAGVTVGTAIGIVEVPAETDIATAEAEAGKDIAQIAGRDIGIAEAKVHRDTDTAARDHQPHDRGPDLDPGVEVTAETT